MARKFISGFEWQSTTAGVEWSAVTAGGTGGSVTISTSTKRSGAASLQIVSAPDSSNYIERDYNVGANTVTFARFYVNFSAFPSDANGAICEIVNGAGTTCGSIVITTAGTLELHDGNSASTQVGSDSAVLSTGTWYRVEIKIENGAGTELEAKLDGSVFASGAMTTATNATTLYLGMTDFVSDMVAFFDDVAVDSTTYPGEGKIVVAVPTGAGDNNPTTGDASMISEIPPSNTATSGSTMIELDDTGTIADFVVTDTATLGIDSYDTISAVQVLIRVREETSAAGGNYQTRLKSASGGTVTSTAASDPGNTTVRTNPNGTTAFARMLISETDPTTGVAWTPTGTNSIEEMQIGVINNDPDATPDLWVTTMAAMIEYVDGVAPGGATPATAFMTTNTRFWGT